MGELDILALISRWVHIGSIIVLVGGSVFLRYLVMPTAQGLSDADRQAFSDRLRNRWRLWVHILVALVLASGVYNITLRIFEVKPMPYHPLLGLKILLSLAVLFIAEALAGKSKGLQPIRDRADTWLTINIVLATVIIMIAGTMKFAPLKPAETPAAVNAAQTSQ